MTDLDQLTQSLAGNLRRLRAERGLTLDALASRAGVSRSMVIQIEQARTNPSVGTVVKIGDALGVSVTTLLDSEPRPTVRLFRAEETVRLWHTEAGSHSTLLAGTEAPGPLELWRWRLMPGEGHEADGHPHGTTELIHVVAGELTLRLGEEEHRVPLGASAAFESHLSHGYRNEGDEPVELLMAVLVPPAPR
ncbi:XRE family transcriptional regulator [Streptomyces sp. DSM 44915]|uniref:XRE family transcriptional regulator n=1 Tax=Streptomyces chisholmiae TaxID=3075540 RepID=A0ABU2JLN4_9ACTN|nr:XRE family transcriptional regulator [Streptomyces sp. DSM 44915]MDT0265889.1 XRE family transcriptional regulator [Streptomyces sp. DSM 44915]